MLDITFSPTKIEKLLKQNFNIPNSTHLLALPASYRDSR